MVECECGSDVREADLVAIGGEEYCVACAMSEAAAILESDLRPGFEPTLAVSTRVEAITVMRKALAVAEKNLASASRRQSLAEAVVTHAACAGVGCGDCGYAGRVYDAAKVAEVAHV